MRIDAVILVKLKVDGELPNLRCGSFIPISDYVQEMAPGATHELSNPWRLYGEHYERGPWPQIAAVLMELLADPNIETVWYGGDSYPSYSQFTKDDLFQTTEYYLKNTHRPYYE